MKCYFSVYLPQDRKHFKKKTCLLFFNKKKNNTVLLVTSKWYLLGHWDFILKVSLNLINVRNWGLAPTKVFFSGYSVEQILEGIFAKTCEKVVQILKTFCPIWAFNLWCNKWQNSTRIFIKLNNVPCRTMALKQTIWRTWFSSCEGHPTICKITSAAVGKVQIMMEIPLASRPLNSLLLS